jgi:hypothetical protein
LPLETGCTWLPLKYRPRASLLQKVLWTDSSNTWG